MAHRLRGRGYTRAAEFLEWYALFIVTFAEVALEGVEIPYPTTRI